MDTFYVFNEYGDFQFTTTDEDYASAWCDANEGYYCCEEQPSLKKNKLKKVLTNHSKRVIMIIENEREVFGMRIDVTMTCPLCGEDHAVEVNLAQYEAWQNGELIQNAMPDLTPTEREQLISGLCPKCQTEMFGE